MWTEVKTGLFAGRQWDASFGAVDATIFLYNTATSDPARHDCWVLTSNLLPGEGVIVGRKGEPMTLVMSQAKIALLGALRATIAMIEENA